MPYSANAILAVYNAESTLRACLDSLLTQSVKLEIIAVDDGSTDSTLSILKSYPHVKVIKTSHAGPAVARNLGAKSAQSEILLFVDADMTFAKDYVKDLLKPIKERQAVGTYTTEERVSNWANIWARCWNLQEGWAVGRRFPKNPPKYGTDFRAILRSEFERVGGFDNIGYTDTWTLFQKLGERPLATKAVCYHKNPDTLHSVFRQARWSAKRPYKFGLFGTLYALLRTSLPISLLIAIPKSLITLNLNFLPFKLVYDWGRFIGILILLITGNKSK